MRDVRIHSESPALCESPGSEFGSGAESVSGGSSVALGPEGLHLICQLHSRDSKLVALHLGYSGLYSGPWYPLSLRYFQAWFTGAGQRRDTARIQLHTRHWAAYAATATRGLNRVGTPPPQTSVRRLLLRQRHPLVAAWNLGWPSNADIATISTVSLCLTDAVGGFPGTRLPRPSRTSRLLVAGLLPCRKASVCHLHEIRGH